MNRERIENAVRMAVKEFIDRVEEKSVVQCIREATTKVLERVVQEIGIDGKIKLKVAQDGDMITITPMNHFTLMVMRGLKLREMMEGK